MLAHQTRMDVVGNNIANADTVGFKGERVMFTDALYAASSGTEVGQGVIVAGTQTDYAQGSLTATGRTTDVAIEGEGFLTVTDGSHLYYTRNGAMGTDANGNLIHLASGMKVVALPPSSGPANTSSITTADTLKVPLGDASIARATGAMSLGGNLDSRTIAGGQAQITAHVYDSLGAGHDVTLTFTRSATAGQWDVTATSPDGTVTAGSPAQVTFDTNGKPTTNSLSLQMTLTNPNGAGAAMPIELSLASTTQLAQDPSLALRTQDGLPPGMLTGMRVDPNGVILGIYSNGLTSSLGQLVTGTFTNTSGLEKVKDSLYQSTYNSGLPSYGIPGSNGRGAIRSGQLEASNVNLAQEFADMIVTQRGFQASSRVVTTADQMLQELMNVAR
jgi:flagellar hook protein FlgE